MTDTLKTYIDKIDKYNKEELIEEHKKLYNLLGTVFQEYRDREETIYLINRQIEEVWNRIPKDEIEVIG